MLGVGGGELGFGGWGLVMVLVLGAGCVVLGVQSEVKCITCASVSPRIFLGVKTGA